MLMSAGFGKTAAGQEKEAYIELKYGYALYFYYDENRASHTQYEVRTINLNDVSDNPEWPWYEFKDDIASINFDASFSDATPKSYKNWFKGFSGKTFYLSKINLSEATTVAGMFEGCNKLKQLYFTGNTQNLTDMSNMFNGCENLFFVDLSTVDTKNVTDVSNMFKGCTKLSNDQYFTIGDGWDISGLDDEHKAGIFDESGVLEYMQQMMLSPFQKVQVTLPEHLIFTGNIKPDEGKVRAGSQLKFCVEDGYNEDDLYPKGFGFDIEDVYDRWILENGIKIHFLNVPYQDVQVLPNYLVTYIQDNDGLANIEEPEETLLKGTKVTKIPSLIHQDDIFSNDGFVGWYTDPNYAEGTKWEWNTPVTTNLTLYPKWEPDKFKIVTNSNNFILLKSSTLENVTIKDTLWTYIYRNGIPKREGSHNYAAKVEDKGNINFKPPLLLWYYGVEYRNIISSTNGQGESFDINMVNSEDSKCQPITISVTMATINATINGKPYDANKKYRPSDQLIIEIPETNRPKDSDFKITEKINNSEEKTLTIDGKKYTHTFTEKEGGNNTFEVKVLSCDDGATFDYTTIDEYKINIELPYTITFSPNGHGTTPEEQSVYEGEKATKPNDPTENGWFFTGRWYTEADCQNEWNFSESTVSANTTLYAQWEKITHSVTFIDGTYSSSTSVNHGDKVAAPNLNNKEGYTLSWTLNEKEYDFTQPVTEDITLKALWTANEKTITPIISVTLESTTIKYPLDHDKYCNNQEPSAIIHYSVDEKSTQPTHYSITFDNTSIPEQNGEINNIGTIEIPMIGIPTGEYAATINFTNDTENAQPSEANFTLYAAIPPDVILKLYHNVIFANNHDSLYNKYQWRKDGKDIAGATKQYYTERPELTGNISVLLTPFVGDPIETCPFPTGVSVKKLASNIKVYPNPATAGKEFKVEILDFADDNDYKLLIFSNEGALIKTVTTREHITEVSLPRGIFTIALTANGEKCGYFKFIVEK